MRKNLFEAGVDVDVEALMSRLRESTKQSEPVVAGVLSPQQLNSRALETLQPQQLYQEIQAGSVHAETLNQIPLKTRGSKIRIERPVKKFLKWLVHWNTRGQVEFNQSVIRSLEFIAQDLQTGQENFAMLEDLRRDIMDVIRQNVQKEIGVVGATLREDLDRNMRDTGKLRVQVSNYLAILEAGRVNLTLLEKKLRRVIEDSGERLREEFGETGAAAHEEMNRYIQLVLEETRNQNEILVAHSSELKLELSHKLDELQMRTLRLERVARNTRSKENAAAEVSRQHLSAAQPDVGHRRTNRNEKLAGGLGTSMRKPLTPAFDYFLFEHQERGPASEIKRRQSIYLDLFRGKTNVVDLGCGRGEFVELLSENGIGVTGVDNSEDMAEFCRDRGLSVIQADIFEYLTSMPDDKFDGVFLSQVVEHFPPEQILRLVSLCAEKLQPGGVLVAETVNTNCPTALSNFFLDPTHIRPVPPELLKFMIEQQGFAFQTFKFSSPAPGSDAREVLSIASGLDQEGILYQDYAVVALRLQRGALEPNAIGKDRTEQSLLSKN